MRFSQRKGLRPIKVDVQIDSIDQELRNALWNAVYIFMFDYREYHSEEEKELLFKRMWHSYFKEPMDTIKNPWVRVRTIIMEGEWYEVYDLIEFIGQNHPDGSRCREYIEFCNSVLKRELSAYRFVNGALVQISNEEEIAEIEEAINSRITRLAPVQEHMRTALDHLADRKNPNYRDSIKESVSAVEAMCIIIDGKKATLGTVLKKIKEKIGLHQALEDAFSKLYGYASDADGIRHALLEDSNLDYEDAKFMLVACSGFINYLIVKGQKAGVL